MGIGKSKIQDKSSGKAASRLAPTKKLGKHLTFGNPNSVFLKLDLLTNYQKEEKEKNQKFKKEAKFNYRESSNTSWMDREKAIIFLTRDHSSLYDMEITHFSNLWIYVQAKDRDNKGRPVILVRRYFETEEEITAVIRFLLKLRRLRLEGMLNYHDFNFNEHRDQKQTFVLDRIYVLYNFTLQQNLADKYSQNGNLREEYLTTFLECMLQVAETMAKMHSVGLSYQMLNHDFVQMKTQQLDPKNIRLWPIYMHSEQERDFFDFYVKDQYDYVKYDTLSFMFIFLSYLNPSQINYETLWNFRDSEVFESEVVKVSDDQLPFIKEFILKSIHFDQDFLTDMCIVSERLRNVIRQGPQTNFRFDSLSAFLDYHSEMKLETTRNYVYYIRKNQLHIYDIERDSFNIIKGFRKKQQFDITTEVAYSHTGTCFYFLPTNQTTKLACLDFDFATTTIPLKYQVDMVKDIVGLPLENCFIVNIDMKNAIDGNELYVMSNKRIQVSGYEEGVYPSYIIQNRQYMDENGMPKMQVRVSEGPYKQDPHKYAYYFYDQHNQMIYGIVESHDIFKNGIKLYYWDTLQRRGNFNSRIIKFACGNDESYYQFSKTNIKLTIQHGVYLMMASQILFVLDLNYQCFFSYCSAWQIQNYKENNLKQPMKYQYAFEIRNQPYKVQYLSNLNQGMHAAFQSGCLYILGRQQIESVICIYSFLPEQGVLELISCESLHTGINYQQEYVRPKNIDAVWDVEQILKSNGSQVEASDESRAEYKIVEQIIEFDKTTIYKVRIDRQFYALRYIKMLDHREYIRIVRLLERNIQSEYIMRVEDCFFSHVNSVFYANIVRQYGDKDLQTEIKHRKRDGEKFELQQVAVVLRSALKAIQELKRENITHGNLCPHAVIMTLEGYFKIDEWYLEKQKGHVSDLADALLIALSMIKLDILPGPGNWKMIEEKKDDFGEHPSTQQFLDTIFYYKDKISNEELNQAIDTLYIQWQHSYLTQNFVSSRTDVILWVEYGSNAIIACNVEQKQFYQTDVWYPNNLRIQFSKYNMFAFDGKQNLYVSGAIKVQKQKFYHLELSMSKNPQLVNMKELEDFPIMVLAPTLIYTDQKAMNIYSFGGYELKPNGGKVTSNQCFVYNLLLRKWTKLPSMPFSLVMATGLYNEYLNCIYLFGGCSEDIDITTPDLTYLVFDIQEEQWKFRLDKGIQSPFMNSRFFKPMVDIVGPETFVCFFNGDDKYQIQFFELTQGGINLCLDYEERDKQRKYEIDSAEKDIFNKGNSKQNQKLMQDDLSFVVFGDLIFVLDEFTRNLSVFNIKDPDQIQFETTVCQIEMDKDDDIVQANIELEIKKN